MPPSLRATPSLREEYLFYLSQRGPRLEGELMQGRKGKKAALAIYCAAMQGLITETDYNSVVDRFGDIGSRSGYNYYMRNPQRFTDLEIEATTNFIQSLINPRGEQPDDAE